MTLVRLISPDGDEVLTAENGAEAMKKNGYKDAPKPKQQAAKKDEAGD